MSTKTTVRGLERFIGRMRKYNVLAIRRAQDVTEAGLLEIETTAKRSIQSGSKSGDLYQKYKPRRQHQASAPGEAPATDTGRLVSSINNKIDPDGLGGVVEAATKYAEHLELGTRHIEPRPFLGPALDENRDKIVRGYKDAIKGAGRKAAQSG